MIIPKVRLEIWKELYETAIRFKEAAPWELLGDDEVFAVKDPGTGEIGYCTVLGWLGEMFALCVYRGDEGLAIYQKLQNQEIDPERDDFFAINNALMAEFTDRGRLDKEDLRIIKELGYKFRGAKAYPAFRSYLPGYAPWFLTESETVFLEFALRCSLDYFNQYDEDAVALKRKDPNQFLLYSPKSNGGETASFERQWFRPEPSPPPALPHLAVDEIRLQKMKKTIAPSEAVWEAGFFYMPGGTVVDRDRPYWPRIVTVADKRSGLMLFSNAIDLKMCRFSALGEGILSTMEKRKICPAEIRVNDEVARKAFQPFADSLGIRLKTEKNLSAIMEFKKAMTGNFSRRRI
jgi:hypothetical protein